MKTKVILADQAFVSGMHFLIGILLARYLGMAGYGEYVLIYGVILGLIAGRLIELLKGKGGIK